MRIAYSLFILVLLPLESVIAQLHTYPLPPAKEISNMHNNDFEVQVRLLPNGNWRDLFEYKTYVNSSSKTRKLFDASSFVAFDFKGEVAVRVVSNSVNIDSLVIRPKSRKIKHRRKENEVIFNLKSPQQLSFEINGNRYRNLHIFANELHVKPPENEITKTFKSGVVNMLNNNEYVAKTGDVIYFEPGAIVHGRISIIDVENVKIFGRGIIDQTHFRKRFTTDQKFNPPYEGLQGIGIRRSKNISVDGMIINDPQYIGVEIVESDTIDIRNLKVFSRVIYGSGVDMIATRNVSITNSFFRTTDDGIAIYASRVRTWRWQNLDAYNYSIKNVSLYSDFSHPIEIGWHGNQGISGYDNPSKTNGNSIYGLRFENIDILEHDEPLYDFKGAISINCGDENRCFDFEFKNINVEDFTLGRLLTIKVEPENCGGSLTDGYFIRNIRFDNLIYNGFSAEKSVVSGLSCERHVNGVHFNNFTINDSIVDDISKFPAETIEFAHNITFEESRNLGLEIKSGIYRVANGKKNYYLDGFEASDLSRSNGDKVVAQSAQDSESQLWEIMRVIGTRIYRIKNLQSGMYLRQSDSRYTKDCGGTYVHMSSDISDNGLDWKIVPNSDGSVSFVNLLNYGYLHSSHESPINNLSSSFIIALQKNESDRQKWALTRPGLGFILKEGLLKRYKSFIKLNLQPEYETPELLVTCLENLEDMHFELLNMNNEIVLHRKLTSVESSIDLSSFEQGVYLSRLKSEKGNQDISFFLIE